MKRTTPSQTRGNLPPRINTPNNPDFIQDYFSGHHQPSPFSPTKSIDNNMYNNMYFPNNQMIPPNHGSPMYNTVDAIENYELGDNKQMIRGMSTPTTPIHPMNDMNQFNVPVQFRNGYEMYGDRQQPMMAPPYMSPYINNAHGHHHGNEDMMVGMNRVMKDQNNNLLSPMENTGGAQNNKKANLYKTELCRSYEETGHCRYGSKCQFAHSENELRPVDRHPKYKTEMCKTFWEQGTCPYGKRCCFIHTSRDLVKKEDTPGHTPTTPAKNMDKKMFPDANVSVNINKKKENSTDTVNNLSEGETIALNSESENTENNRSRSGSDSATATSMTEEVILSSDNEEKIKTEVTTTIKITDESNKENEDEKDKTNKNEKKTEKEKEKQEIKESDMKNEKNEKKNEKENEKVENIEGNDGNKKESKSSKGNTTNDNILTIPVIVNKVQNLNKNIQANAMPIKGSKTPTTNQAFNYSTSFNGSINLNGSPFNNNFVPHRKMSSPAQRQTPRMMNNGGKGLNLNLDSGNNYNVLGINSMSYQPTSPLDNEFLLNHDNRNITSNKMSTSLPANDLYDDKIMLKLHNLHLQNSTPPHTPVNGQRTPQTNQGMMSPLSTSFNQNSIFMKQPLNINTTQNNSNLFFNKISATASPFTPGTPSSFLSPKQTYVGLPSIPLIDDESGSVKAGSLSGVGSDFGDETKSEDNSTTSSNTNNNGLFAKQTINTSKTGTQAHSILKTSQKPSTPKNPSFIPSTPQSISTGFLNNGCASPLPNSRMGTSLPATPIHQNSFNPSAIDEIFSGNNTIINDYNRVSSSGINIAASPFTPSNDLSQYMVQMSSGRDNSGIQSLENIKSPSQMFYRPSSNSISAINTTPSAKSTGFGSMTMGGINMVKNRSESFDYGMLSPGGMNSYLSNPISSPVGGFNNSIASSFNNNTFLNNKMRSESVDFGQLNHFNKENNMVGSVPTLSFLQSINEGIPDSPFSNHGSIQGSPLPSSTTTLNDLSGGMENFIGSARRKSFQDSTLMNTRLPTVPEGRHPNILEEEDEPLFSNNNLTDEGILKFSKEHFGLDDAHSKSLLGGQGSSAMDIKGSILGGNIFSPMSPTSNSHNIF